MELAVGIVVLLIMVAGLIDLGRGLFYFLGMRDAAEEGMVYGAVYPTFCSQIVNMVKANANDTSLDVTVLVDNVPCVGAGASHACSEKEIQVVVSQPNFPITMPFIGAFIGTQSLSLETKVKGTILRPECP